MEKADVKFSEWLEQGFNVFKEGAGVLIPAMLIALLLSVFTAGILAGPMAAGMIIIALRLVDRDANPPQVGDLFKGFDYFAQSFLFYLVAGIVGWVVMLVLNLVPILGQIAAMFFSYAYWTVLMFAMYLIVDRKMDFWPAAMASFEKVKTNFWPFFAFGLVTGILGMVGAAFCGIGVIVSMPVAIAMTTVAYRDVFGSNGTIAVAAEEVVDTPVEAE